MSEPSPPGDGPEDDSEGWPSTTRWSLIGVAVVSALMVIGFVFLELLERTTTAKTLLEEPVSAVFVDTTGGDLILVAGSGPELIVERTENWTLRAPAVDVGVVDGVARVIASCSWVPFSSCAVDVRVTVPPGVRVEARTTDGRVTLDGLDGWVTVETTNGRVTGTNLRTPEVLVTTSNSPVLLEFDAPPSRVVVATSNGDVELTLPGGPYRTSLASSNGAVVASVPVDEFGERSIDVATSNGDISLLPG